MKKIVQNIALSTILLTTLVPVGMGAMGKQANDWIERNEILYPKKNVSKKTGVYYAKFLRDILAEDEEDIEEREITLDLALKAIDVDAKDKHGQTALHWAVEHKVDLVKYLVEHGADVNMPDKNGWTVILKAVYYGVDEVVKYLVEVCKVDVNAPRADGVTLLHVAAKTGNIEIVKFLVDNEAGINAKTNRGFTVQDFAKNQQIKDYLQLVEDFYAVNEKKMAFDEFVKKYLDAQTPVNLDDIFNLLHLGTREFMKKFFVFTEEHKIMFLSPANYDSCYPQYTKEIYFCLGLAKRFGTHQAYWLTECFKHCASCGRACGTGAMVNGVPQNATRFEWELDKLYQTIKENLPCGNKLKQILNAKNETSFKQTLKSELSVPKKYLKDRYKTNVKLEKIEKEQQNVTTPENNFKDLKIVLIKK